MRKYRPNRFKGYYEAIMIPITNISAHNYRIGVSTKKPESPFVSSFFEEKAPPPDLLAPKEPGPEDCCMSGCSRCVWDIFREDSETFKELANKKGLNEVDTVNNPFAAGLQAFEQLEQTLMNRKK